MDKVFSRQSERAIPLPVSEAASSAGVGSGRLLASVGADGAVRLWDPRRPALVSQLKVGVSVAALTWGPGVSLQPDTRAHVPGDHRMLGACGICLPVK
jgi:hypothetical protein